ncbi:hypothetical protein LINPERPRIM_LOCUS11054 [Linum perenne]
MFWGSMLPLLIVLPSLLDIKFLCNSLALFMATLVSELCSCE